MSETQNNVPIAAQPAPGKSNEATILPVSAAQVSNGKQDGTAKAAANEKDPMRNLLDQMDRLQPMIAAVDPELARTIRSLSQQGTDPERREKPGFRTGVAYVLEDLEKAHTGRLGGESALRTEMTRLAGTAPGLENERMIAVMRGTASIDDRSFVKEIRMLAGDIAKKVDQTAPDIESKVSALENRLRLADRRPEQTQEARASSPTPSAATGTDWRGQRSGTEVNQSDRAGPNIPPGGPPPPTGGPRQDNIGMPSNGQNQGGVTIQHSVLDTLLRAMRPDPKQPSPPWEPPATPMGERFVVAEQKVDGKLDERTFVTAAVTGKAALEALQEFANGGGAAVITKIREAAKTEPGGLPQVLSEMKEGGRFADLRKQFSNALADDAGAAAVYDKAASSLAAYGKNRTDVQDIVGRRTDSAALTQRFEQLDAEIGKAASATPSKTEGRSMMEDLGKQAAELLLRAVDAVKSAVRRPSASASPSPT